VLEYEGKEGGREGGRAYRWGDGYLEGAVGVVEHDGVLVGAGFEVRHEELAGLRKGEEEGGREGGRKREGKEDGGRIRGELFFLEGIRKDGMYGRQQGREGGREGTHLVHGSLQAGVVVVENLGAFGHVMLELGVLGREGGREGGREDEMDGGLAGCEEGREGGREGGNLPHTCRGAPGRSCEGSPSASSGPPGPQRREGGREGGREGK